VGDSLKVLSVLGNRLAAVRLDTSEKMIDKSLSGWLQMVAETQKTIDLENANYLRGVNKHLVGFVRSALDLAGGRHVKIIVSGGFNVSKITEFEAQKVPVDMYGVGSSIVKTGPDFTADIVLPVGKAGRTYRPNPRLKDIKEGKI